MEKGVENVSHHSSNLIERQFIPDQKRLLETVKTGNML